MTVRNIIKINENKCNGCGQCVSACAEGAIQLVNGKAKLISETYCDGLGACIGHCPQDAITIEQREASEFDEQAVKDHLAASKPFENKIEFTCPGMMAKDFSTKQPGTGKSGDVSSQLGQWPVQLKLVPANAPYLKGADLLLTADCVPFAMGDFHQRFLKDRRIVIGCPKLDDTAEYLDKLEAILRTHQLNSLTVIHMEVPCCSGLTRLAQAAIEKAGINQRFEDVTIALDGTIKSRQTIHSEKSEVKR